MIIKKDYLNTNRSYLEREQEGLSKSIENLNKRFQNEEIERDKFLEGLDEFSKKQINLKKRIEKLNRK